MRKIEDLAEADYCGKEAKDMQDHWVKIGGLEIPVHVIDATDATDATADGGDGGEGPKVEWQQEMFTDADAVQQLHPKIRRLIKAQLKSHSDTTKAKNRRKLRNRLRRQG